MDSIQIPPKTQARLIELVTVSQKLQAQIDAIILTLRETLDVPEDYTLTDVRAGFEPAAKQEVG